MDCVNSFNHDVDHKYIMSLLEDLSSGGGDGRLATLAKLKKVNRTSFLKVTRNFLGDSDAEKRRVAVEALMETDPKNNIELVLPLLNDPEPFVRSAVIYRIKQSKVTVGKEVIDLFAKALREDPSPDVRTEAADMLGYCGTPKAKAALSWAAEHDFESDEQNYVVSDVAKNALERLAESDQ